MLADALLPDALLEGALLDGMVLSVDAAGWDERYRSASVLWSGRPNPHLVAEASGLRPSVALDVGCGEGADAFWLAEQGWQVTAAEVAAGLDPIRWRVLVDDTRPRPGTDRSGADVTVHDAVLLARRAEA